MAGFLGVPLKKSPEVDLGASLGEILAPTVLSTEKQKFTESLKILNSMRRAATDGKARLSSQQSAEKALALYHDQLGCLEARVPPQNVRVAFEWRNAFDEGFYGRPMLASFTRTTIGYEKVCILFNYAATLSQIAARCGETIDDEESLKTAAKLFQRSAGLFHHVRSICPFTAEEGLTADLQQDTLTALYNLCLAQAQECIYHKALADGRKDELLAQISRRCEELYTDAWKFMNKYQQKSLWSKSWVAVVRLKEAAFRACTQYHMALVARSDMRRGEELARWKSVIDNLERVKLHSQSVTTVILGGHYKQMMVKAEQLYAQTLQSNNAIYKEKVPHFEDLPHVKSVILAKGISPEFPLAGEEQLDMFANLPQEFSEPLPWDDTDGSGVLTQASQIFGGVLALGNIVAGKTAPA